MERSISNRFYFDYNATSPLSKKVTDYLHRGDFLWGNPASLHQTGKRARKLINETSDYLHQLLGLNSKEYHLFFHSGASEGINSIFKGLALESFKKKEVGAFFFSSVDHSAVISLKEALELFHHKVYFFDVDKNGLFHKEQLTEALLEEKRQGRKTYLNYTQVNNETGVHWPLAWASEIKKVTGSFIHVDAVQSVGKVFEWKNGASDLDSYTYSGHKFGALKGVGVSFIKKGWPLTPLIHGGGQQEGLRAGTENALGIISMKLALEEMDEHLKLQELLEAKTFLEEGLTKALDKKGEIVGVHASHRNLNTIFLILYGQKASTLSAKFDMEGVDLSTGSACSSGIIKENRVLLKMGYGPEDAKAGLRFSFSPFMTMNDAALYLKKIQSVLKI